MPPLARNSRPGGADWRRARHWQLPRSKFRAAVDTQCVARDPARGVRCQKRHDRPYVVGLADTLKCAARRAAQPAKASFALGFLTGQEMDWMPEAMRILRNELPNTDVTVSSNYSPDLADALMRGRIDLAFMRREQAVDLEYVLVTREPLVVVLPSDHRLTARESIAVRDLVGEPFIGMSSTAPTLQIVIEDYLKRSGVALTPTHRVDNLGMAMSLIASTRGIALLPAYTKNFLPWSVVSRPLEGEGASIDLVVGYSKANGSAVLKLFLSRLDDLIVRVAQKTAV